MEGCYGTLIEGHSRERVWLFKSDPYTTQKATMNLMAVLLFRTNLPHNSWSVDQRFGYSLDFKVYRGPKTSSWGH